MSSQPPQQPQSDWTKGKFYAAVTILTALIGLGIQALLVPPAWWPIFWPPASGPAPQSSPTPATSPSAAPVPRQQNVCGVWLSTTSQKRYDFICQGQAAFEVYEVTAQGLNKIGSGRLTEDGNVEASLFISPKNRRAYLNLKLSSDGRKLEGTWKGDDPREFGQLQFNRA
jgi:hypothetical protein